MSDGATGALEFLSLTPSGPSALLAGQAPVSPIRGTLTLPGPTGVYPAMVLAHGSGGMMAGREETWAERLRALGVATFVIDSFGPRGLGATGADQSRLSLAASTADALSALALLATHPGIDAKRIGIMGFSKGGQVALYSALDPFRRAVLPHQDLMFALHIAFYTSCSIPYKATSVSPAPILMLLAGADDLTPAAACVPYADWFRSKGAPVAMEVFPGAFHGFDLPQAPRRLSILQSARDCRLEIELEPVVAGRMMDTGAAIPADGIDGYLRSCMGRGGTVGGNRQALDAAITRVGSAVATFLMPAMQ
ncbi:dienelactone hydrolase family protein [Lacibacterium aquatile]|uniref:Dienelactone hydrolase family protein n=1 Tax=Lacibacterium aquatile TaxID=1168082 RepID=A0ABW5DUM5_9PROT